MNGTITSAYFFAGIITIIFSFIIIARYKKALKILMNSGFTLPEETNETYKTISKSYHINYLSNVPSIQNSQIINKRKWQAFLNFLFAFLVYIIVYSILDLNHSNNSFSFYRLVFMVLLFATPIFLLYILIFNNDPKIEISLFLKLFSVNIIVLTIYQYFASISTTSILEGLKVYLVYNLVPIILIFLFRLKAIKAISVTISIFAFITILIGFLIVNYFLGNETSLRTASDTVANIGFRGQYHNIAFFAIILTIGAILAWQLLRIFKNIYANHQITYLQLLADGYLLIFGIYQAGISGSVGNGAYFVLLFSLSAYKIVTIFLFKINSDPISGQNSLLYLRVFDLGKKTETLFKAIETDWRFAGPIQLITGPDLAHSTVEPHEIITYLAGNLNKSFSTNPQQVTQNLSQIYNGQLFDYSFPTNEMFCDKNHWKMVLLGLVKTTDIVLMDLRGFNENHLGCIFEINQLCFSMDLEKCVFIVDRTTNLDLLSAVFKKCSENIPTNSPNASKEMLIFNLLILEELTKTQTENLTSILLAKA